MEDLKWIPLLGNFDVEPGSVFFHGGQSESTGEGGKTFTEVGNLLSNQFFSGGTIQADVEFKEVTDDSACGLMLFYQPAAQTFIEAQIGGPYFCSLWSFSNRQFRLHGQAGYGSLVKPERKYHFRVSAFGSSVTFNVDGVNVLTAILPFPLPRGQVGIWCRSKKDILITNFTVETEKPIAFIVMQFASPYNELYSEVIKSVCEQSGLVAVRADETLGPGIIIQDIERQILEAQIVIADITPTNPNVYYEVGYAQALKKPTILIAETSMKLPFDVSAFRVLFYENTISGKAKVEMGLRNHLQAIMRDLTSQ